MDNSNNIQSKEPTMSPKKSNNTWLFVIITIIVTTVIVGVGMYLWQSKVFEDESKELNSKINELQEEIKSMPGNPKNPSVENKCKVIEKLPDLNCQKEGESNFEALIYCQRAILAEGITCNSCNIDYFEGNQGIDYIGDNNDDSSPRYYAASFFAACIENKCHCVGSIHKNAIQ